MTHHDEQQGDEKGREPEELDPLTVGELLSLAQAAEYTGLSHKSLRNYILLGRLKAKKLGSQWVTTRLALDEYIASRSLENIPKKYRNRA